MRDYDENLVKTLRNNAEHFMTTDYEWSNALVHLLLDSADAIEQKKERAEMVGLDGDICYLPNTLRQILISNPNMGAFKKETLCKAADAIEELLAKDKNVPDKNVGEWISVEERLPDEDTTVLAFHAPYELFKNGTIRTEWIDFRGEWANTRYYGPVTHWMPLPQPPKEGN